MCLEIGNTVAVVDDIIKGVIVAIDNNTVKVEDEEGMFFVFSKNELVKVDVKQDELLKYSSINNAFLKQKTIETKKNKSAFKKVKQETFMEVDLHAEKLVKSLRGLDNYDILNIQINTAKRKLEFAINKRISKIVFIHGVGEGVLKTELRTLLNRYAVKYYDASYKKYGLGATEVYIYQNQ